MAETYTPADVLTGTGFDVEAQTPDDDELSGFWCVATDPFPCPAGCLFIANHMTVFHLILVWPEKDDPNLLRHANHAKEVGRNPRIVEYEPSMGRAINYYQYRAKQEQPHRAS
jgi:hypothetical protein